jgi:hypothetical protein
MGWGRMFLMGDVGQQLDISDLSKYLNPAISEINQNQRLD